MTRWWLSERVPLYITRFWSMHMIAIVQCSAVFFFFFWLLLLESSHYITECVRVSVSSPNLRIVFGIARSGFDRRRRLMFVFSWVSFLTYRRLSWLSATCFEFPWCLVLFSTYYQLQRSEPYVYFHVLCVGCNWRASCWFTNWSHILYRLLEV